jgi:splicing factor 3B subunit 3
VSEGRQRTKFLAVGFSDNTCRILGLDSDSCLHKISVQALPAAPESVCFMSVEETDALYLHVGLANGVLVRSHIDNVTGGISDTRQ